MVGLSEQVAFSCDVLYSKNLKQIKLKAVYIFLLEVNVAQKINLDKPLSFQYVIQFEWQIT